MTTTRPLRLGFPVKVMGNPELKSNDTRRWQTNPHLKASLEYLDAILDYLAKHKISMYRMSSDLAPYATHPDMPQFHGMVAESAAGGLRVAAAVVLVRARRGVLGEELDQDLPSGGAEGAAQADLGAAFEYGDDHGVGHADAAEAEE